ncbi:DBH-like monooxygenase protein 2-like protein [Trichoplax sp. H2]|nr:DBH-like monooxygenase protein 2-like protein [Trichoplax sp. H2]|eukprot:RDD36646.1 DBH-like monooxygenase protein 2-like protein [Trichoplax sp. H2]
MSKLESSTCAVLLLVSVTTAANFHVSIDEDLNYLLDWSYNEQDSTMEFTVRIKTTGWVGFGISPYTGQMPESDVVIRWVDSNGKAYLQDRFATGWILPILDSSQDYTLLSDFKVNGTTTLKFRRKCCVADGLVADRISSTTCCFTSLTIQKWKELPIISTNPHYDFNYQELYYLKKEGGLSTREEMGLNYAFYYPKINFGTCSTLPGLRI